MDNTGQGRLQDRKPVAVIDIGSNSIRLVVYEGLSRSPTPLFQEKAMCGLGRFLNSTRRLNEETIPYALASLARFAKLAAICGVKERDLHPFATAAVRWAEDGAEFLALAGKLAVFRSKSSAISKRPNSPLPASERGFCILQASWAT